GRRCGTGTAARTAGRTGSVALQLHARAARWVDAKILDLVSTDLHDGNFDNDFRRRLIDVVDKFLRQQNLVWRSAHHNRLLGRQLLNPEVIRSEEHTSDS